MWYNDINKKTDNKKIRGYMKSREYNFNKIKQTLVCFDLDGTLLNEKGELGKNTIELLKKVQAAGHIVCLVTGRPYSRSIKFYQQLGLNTLMVNQNGAYITNPSDSNFQTLAFGFKNEIAKKILCNKVLQPYYNNALIAGINTNWLWHNENDGGETNRMKTLFDLEGSDPLVVINKDDSKIISDVPALLLHVNDAKQLGLFIYEIKNIAPTMEVWNWSFPQSSETIIEINSIFNSKRTAIKFLSAYYGISQEHCIAFGDGVNDVGMISWASWGFAMQNAVTSVVLVAKYMTKYDHCEDGAARELVKLLEL